MKIFWTTAILTMALAVSAASQIRVGYMNPQTVLDNIPEKEAIERQLDRLLDQREAEFEEMAIEFQNQLARFQEQAPGLSEEQIQRRQQELQEKDEQLSEFQRRVDREFQQRQSELLRPVLQKMNEIIESISRERNIDYVLNEATAEGELFLMYISDTGKEQLNLTDEVLSRMLN